MTDFFGAPNSDGSSYFDLGFNYDVGNGFGVNAHVGYQTLIGDAIVPQINGSTPDSITDYKIGGTYTVDGFVLGAAFVGTNRDYSFGTAFAKGKNISDNTFVVSVPQGAAPLAEGGAWMALCPPAAGRLLSPGRSAAY